MTKILILFLLFSQLKAFAQLSDFPGIDFTKADSIASLYYNENLNNLPRLSYLLTSDLNTDIEKFRAVYTWVSNNIENDFSLYQKNERKLYKFRSDQEALKKWQNKIRRKFFRDLLRKQKTICTGYAYLVRELSTLADIDCKIIDGYGRNIVSNISEPGLPNHSWNAVKLNGKWYLCDPTLSSGSNEINNGSATFVRDFFDGYFLANPRMFVTNHYPMDTAWLLINEKPELKDFLNAPIIYKDNYRTEIYHVDPTTKDIETVVNKPLTFLLDGRKNISPSKLGGLLSQGQKETFFDLNAIRDENSLIIFEYTFKKPGNYDLHLMYEGKYIMTFSIQVNKHRTNRDDNSAPEQYPNN